MGHNVNWVLKKRVQSGTTNIFNYIYKYYNPSLKCSPGKQVYDRGLPKKKKKKT